MTRWTSLVGVIDLALGGDILGFGGSTCLHRAERWRHNALDPRKKTAGALERDFIRRPVEEPVEQRLLGPDDVHNARFDAGLTHEVVDVDGATLPEAVDPTDSLLQHPTD